MTTYSVKEIWRYPVKSMRGEQLTETVLTGGGVPLDRGWAVRDEETQTIVGAKKIAGLMLCSASYIDGTNAGSVPHVSITLPDGSSVRSDQDDVNGKLSTALERQVTLWPLQPAENKEHYRINAQVDDIEAELRALFALEEGENLPDLTVFPPDVLAEIMEFATPVGTYFDAFPVNILTEASIRQLQAHTPEADLNVRRFRPNFLIADDNEEVGLVEESWLKSQVGLGTATLDIASECPRCIMTTRPQEGLPRDPSIMRALVANTNHNLSVYCNVVKGGRVAIGDTLTLG